MQSKVMDTIQKQVITFPGGMGDVNSYLITGANGYTIIDTGMKLKEAITRWKAFMETGVKVEKVVLTHTHEDHIGLASWFQEKYSIPIVVSRLGYHEMSRTAELTVEEFNQFITKFGGPEVPEKYKQDPSIYTFTPDVLFEDKEEIMLGDEKYETIWTPGHAYDHFCFYNRESEIMIVGDHILKELSPVIGLWNAVERNPLEEYFTSLERIKEYPVKVALTGHGENIEHFQRRINEIEERHHERLKQVLESIENQPKTAREICQEIYGTTDVIIHLSSFMATLTRLIYLESLGKAERIEQNGIISFQAL
ncbi:MBL fold metallo-hydrolase [Oceanobacillus piezotolerans]|uniref:MBL fold metallo-hydrolase n=1 Tax=Oceanobacillus piezotolerans TaxID=2448030 RepID=A0A498DA78_9BACI|nr:MBL fold metallo-hydrolase [Oceanobacillus piezotolerans]RLL44930.1 MBL fold metallo-hydrolase [Oceanobacillus piezotolerans]